jgi:uncharacterized protein (DUF2062 family)
MNNLPEENAKTSKLSRLSVKQKIKDFVVQARQLQGDPHSIATGMAIGVFIGVTPTIPLHTVLAVALAFIFRCSKLAAIIGVWVGNPITIPFFYLGSYQLGAFLFNISTPFNPDHISINQLMELGLEIAVAMNIGGVLLGIPFGVAAYFVTLKAFKSMRERKRNADIP